MTRGPDLRPAGFCCPGSARPRPGAIEARHPTARDNALTNRRNIRMTAAVGLIMLAISGLVLIVLSETFA
jgi:hypothetical protein